MNQERARAWARSNGLTLDVKNHGEHWIFRGDGLLSEFWPSTGKLVHGKSWKRAACVRDLDSLLKALGKRLPRPAGPARRVEPAYLGRLRELAEVMT